MKFIVILPAIGMLFSPNLYAKCDKTSKTVFSCLTTKGKQIEVCDNGKVIAYSYGKPNVKPEMAFSVPRAQATTSQWNGVGRYESYAIDIPNKTTTYSVFFGTDRLTDKHTVEAGVNVMIKKKLAGTVNCAGKNITNNLEGLTLKPTP